MKNLIRIVLSMFSSFLIVVATASTQNSTTVVLNSGTIDEFIEAIPNIIRLFTADVAIPILEDEFWLRYADGASQEQISIVYELLNDGWRAYAFYSPYLYIEYWHFYLLEKWFNENQVDLAEISAFEFGDYHVTVTELFVSDTEQSDWLLSVRYPTFAHYWLARRDLDKAIGYELVSLPTAFYEANFAWSQQEGGGPRDPVVEDVTGDGLVEFIFTDWMALPGSWTHASNRSYEVISWGEEGLYHILYTQILDDDPTPWARENMDDDPVLEIIQTVNYEDNLGCRRESIIIFDYVEDSYVVSSDVSTFEDTIYCDLHQAEDAYNDKNLSSAIEYYQKARERYTSMKDSEERDKASPHFMYASEKLAISYALLGQTEEAEALIVEMNTVPQPENTIAYALGEVIDDGTNVVEICHTAYASMEAFIANDWRANYRGIPHIGRVNEVYYGENYPDGAFNEICDLTFVLETILVNEEILVSTSPVTFIQDRGFTVKTTFSSDINDDGVDEWILWIDRVNFAYLFLSNAETYSVSMIHLRESNQKRLFREVRLPSGEFALAIFDNYQVIDCVDGVMNDINTTGMYETSLWILNQEGEFVEKRLGLLCAENESPEMISFDETITLWNIGPHDTSDAVTSREMVWNPEIRSYTLATPLDASSDTVVTIPTWRIRDDIYFQKDYEAAIYRINQILDTKEGEERAELLYYRGLAHQMRGNDEDALADYTSVFFDFGWSIWGHLADVQLSKVEPEKD